MVLLLSLCLKDFKFNLKNQREGGMVSPLPIFETKSFASTFFFTPLKIKKAMVFDHSLF